jgi:hypothetical protein
MKQKIAEEKERRPRPRPGGGKRLAGIVVGIGGVALVGGGVAFGLQAQAAEEDLEELSRTGGMWDQDLYDSGERAALLSTIGFAAGGVAIAAGVGLWLWGRSEGARVEVAPAPGGGTVGVSWSF